MHTRKIYLIRHGETDNNSRKILQGGKVNIGLNNTGKQQAMAFYKNYHAVPFKKIYTSTLNRSIESVQAFIDDGKPHYAIPELNEVSYGIYDGNISSEGETSIYRILTKQWEQGNLSSKMEGGESPLEVQQRLKKFIHSTLEKENESPILICMHGRALRIFLATVLQHNLSAMELFQHTNLGLYILNYRDGIFTIEVSNDTSHLEKIHSS